MLLYLLACIDLFFYVVFGCKYYVVLISTNIYTWSYDRGAGGVMSTLNFVLFTLATWLLPDASPRSLSQKSPFRCFSPSLSHTSPSDASPRILPDACPILSQMMNVAGLALVQHICATNSHQLGLRHIDVMLQVKCLFYVFSGIVLTSLCRRRFYTSTPRAVRLAKPKLPT